MEPLKREIAHRFVSLASPTAARNGAGFHPCQGLYHTPKGARPRTALIATHYNVDFSEHYLADEMAALGFGFLGWNTRFRGAETYFLLDHALIDIAVGIRWLREEAGVEQVVLLGNSGGGSLLAAYQSHARAGELGQAPTHRIPGWPRLPHLDDLPAADLYISLNAHPGRPEVLTAWMDPSVVDESDAFSVDPALDMFDPSNGPPYAPEFVLRYRAGQVARNHRISAWARAELENLASRGYSDRVFTLPRTWADLRFMDGTLDPSDRPIGSCYAGKPARANFGPFGIGYSCTLRTWLSMWSLDDSGCCGAPHLERIFEPSLVIQSRGDTGVFPSDAEAIFASLGARDKRLDWVDGDHYLQQPEDARAAVALRIAEWLGARAG
jgi:hypothetical protein